MFIFSHSERAVWHWEVTIIGSLCTFLGFLDGWADDEICLRRQPGISNSVLSLAQIKHFDSPRDLAKAIIDSKVSMSTARSQQTWDVESMLC